MIFNSFQFIWLFPVIFVGYYLLHALFKNSSKERVRRWGNAFLLIASYGLYIQWNPAYALILLGVTAVTYLTALLIERKEAYGRKKYIIYTGGVIVLLPLCVFKYYNFITESAADFLAQMNIATSIPGLNLAIPVGISFFTFQAIGYLWDVYYQRIKAEHDWWDYMLFVSFFPQIMSGPISKAKDLLPQIKSYRSFNEQDAAQGMKWFLWGMFLKLMMADRLAMYVNPVFDNYQYNSGTSCMVASVLYTFQIYGDFAGYSFMAIGVGKLMGFDLINNFNRPYLSTSITDFWRRWHISLSTWLKDYVYIPLGGSRCSKAICYLNIMVTFLVSGIWHGANWTFVLWGVMHGVFQVVEKALGMQKCESKRVRIVIPRIIVTFLIVTIAWIFFRVPTIGDGFAFIERIFTDYGAVLKPVNTHILFSAFALLTVSATDIMNEFFPDRFRLIGSRNRYVRWATYYVLALMIFLCGVFDSSQFIYVSF